MSAAVAGTGENPLLDHLGIRLLELEFGQAVFGMDIGPQHLNRQGSLQGGVIATLLDAACGYAGLPIAGHRELGSAVTLMLSISYHARVKAGRLRCVGTVTKAGRSIYFSRADLLSEKGELVATAQGTFKKNDPNREER